MTRVKCCGMFRAEDIDAVNAARPDFCGFVIDFARSRRSVSVGEARDLRMRLDAGIAAVGVLVDKEPREIAKIADECALDAVQLHGHEDEACIRGLRALSSVAVIQAFKVEGTRDLEAAAKSSADFVLLDNGQGTGSAFDWDLLDGFGRPYFLAGGLTPETIPGAIGRLHPYAVDLSSGLETDGLKDPARIARAVENTRRRR